MTDGGLPAEVRSLLNGPVSTMAHVEALLLLRGTEPDPRPLDEIAVRAQIGALPAARRCMDELAAAGLVAPGGSGEYRYAPASPALRAAVDALHRAYNERPVTLVRAIYSRPPAPVRSFADAFRLRNEG